MLSHDKMFKRLLAEFLPDLIELFAPELAEYAEFGEESGSPMEKEILTDLTDGETHEVDLVSKVKVKGEDSYFLVHIETQAQHQSEFPRRMFKYFARLHEKYALPIYPIVMFTFDEPYKKQPDSYEICFPNKSVLKFCYEVIQLNRLEWRDYCKSDNRVAAALMSKMRMSPEERARVKATCDSLVVKSKSNAAQKRMALEFIDAYLKLTVEEELEYEELVSRMEKPVQEELWEYETSWERKGRLQGHEEGRQEGRQEGLVDLISMQLRRRFANLDQQLLERLRALNSEAIIELGNALFDFVSVADFENWLNERSI